MKTKQFALALTLVATLLAACSADTITGPGEEDRGLEPTDMCDPTHMSLC
jgi:predicted small secreted protein